MPEMQSLSQLIRRTINSGAPLYNKGNKKECFELYLETAELAFEQKAIAKSEVGQLLKRAINEATLLGEANDWAEGAWVLRRCFDDVLSRSGNTSLVVESRGYWQDEKVQNTSDLEKGQCLADVAYILRASIPLVPHTRYTKTYQECFRASEAVDLLTSLGIAGNRKMAAEKCSLLLKGSLIIPVSHKDETNFKDGTHLYTFPDREELQQAIDRIAAGGKHTTEGIDDAILYVALQATIGLPITKHIDTLVTTTKAPSARHLLPRRASILSQEQVTGHALAQLAATMEKAVEIKDRRYNLKTYEKCFVGSEAVTVMIEKDLAQDRQDAAEQLNSLLEVGLIHHVTREHLFHDKMLFYRFTTAADIKTILDTYASLPKNPVGQDKVRHIACANRYKQFADLNVTEILNTFYGCEDESGWDVVDLQNWRDNMKRWGFGRREDQDDEMVDRLSPLVLNVDPLTWDVSGDEEWESPNGILAQIAIFDQVPRSAFRGTADAFKWDELAIRACKVAIEKGYFESAYKSTLNQFLLLLPLEHSESWEDQKLGVQLLLQLLSTVAVQDENLSDYEIVKRLEFSKRLTTAFLEHAQVIAKFKRYPHRNRPHGRVTTLEERIWLASDLVPRWAKSQNPEDARNVIQVPVIPLKRLTRGR